jgi:hypothetical protein
MAQTNVQVFSGSVGIGTTSAGAPLSILSTSGNHLRLHYNDAYYNTLERDTSGNFNIRASDGVGGINTQMTILSNGNVGIGTADPSQGNLTVQGLGADPYFFGQSSGTYADATDFTGLGHFKSTGSHGVIRVSNSSDTSGSTRIDFNTRLGGYWGTNSVLSSFFRGTAPAAGRIMVSGETGDYYEDACMTFWTCRDGYDTGGRFDNLGGTGSLRERMRITSNGNVGIGVTTPSQKLHVNGNAQISLCGIKSGSGNYSGSGVYTGLNMNGGGGGGLILMLVTHQNNSADNTGMFVHVLRKRYSGATSVYPYSALVQLVNVSAGSTAGASMTYYTDSGAILKFSFSYATNYKWAAIEL